MDQERQYVDGVQKILQDSLTLETQIIQTNYIVWR